MAKYLIKFGVGGGYNDTENYSVVDCETQEQAESEAQQSAIETFDSYDVQMECDIDEDEDGYLEERESWLEYSAELYDEVKHKDIEINQ